MLPAYVFQHVCSSMWPEAGAARQGQATARAYITWVWLGMRKGLLVATAKLTARLYGLEAAAPLALPIATSPRPPRPMLPFSPLLPAALYAWSEPYGFKGWGFLALKTQRE